MPSLGLAGRIILGVALGLAAILFLFGFLAVTAVQQSKEQVLQQRLALSETIASHIDYTLGRVLRQMEDSVSRTPINRADSSIEDERQLLSDTYHKLGAFSTVELVDGDGTVAWTEPTMTEAFGANIAGQSHINRLLTTGVPSIDLVVAVTASEEPVVALSVPLWSKGVVVGGMIGKLSLSRVGLDTLPAPNLGPTGRAELISKTGLVIVSSDGSPSGFVDHVVVLQDLLDRRQAGITLHKMPAGSVRPDHIVAYAPLTTLPWGIVIEQDQDVALALPQELQTKMALIGVLALLVAGGVAWVGVRRLVRPLLSLTIAAERIASGDLDKSLVIKRRDELGALAFSFEAMRLKLRSSLEEIRRWNEELEKRVERRTRELARRNQELTVINSLAETVNSSLDLEEVLSKALDQVLAITEAETASISLRDEHSGAISKRIIRPSDSSSLVKICENLEECLCSKVAFTGEPLMIGPDSQDKERNGAVCLQNGFRSLVVLPLRSKHQVQGVLYLASRASSLFSTAEEQRLLASITHQIGIAVENARLYGEIQLREDMRRQLLAKVITAQEEERKRLARELHDESSQTLTALIMSIQAAQEALPVGLEKEKERLARAKAQAIHALTEMRKMILDLRPTALDDLGLVPAIRWYSETHLQPSGIQFSVEARGNKGRLPAELETSLFRIFQEAINNVARHSKAKRTRIQLDVLEEEVHCIVEDDGQGFEAGVYMAHQGRSAGLGLLGMRERVALLAGSLSIESSQGRGTRLRVSIPLKGG